MSRIASALFLCFVLAPSGSAEAAPASRVILVLDASGSMWGQIDGRAKIEIAREVVGELLADWDPDVHVGLASYGHRRKGDCQDIEMLVSPQPVDRAAIQGAVDDINPKGKTPLSAAVVHAAEALRYTEEKATVILVSDGRETCDADPCAIGSRLEESGIDFTAHVIGFDVAERADREQLRCLAENTGGEFHVASDASSLNKAMQRTVEAARAPTPKRVPVVTTARPVIEAGCSFTAAQIQGDEGSTHVVACPAGCEGGGLWGTDTYTADSRVCAAGMHAGFFGKDGGVVGVILAKGRPAYRGSKRHGIQSSDYGAYGKSFTAARSSARAPAPPEPATVSNSAEAIEAGCSFTAAQIEGRIGSTHRVNCPAGCEGGVWGTDAYTRDSRVCVAAVHAGAISDAGGDVAVALDDARPAFRGSVRNGVSSSDYGPYGASFRVGRASPATSASPASVAPTASAEVIEAGCSFTAAQIQGDVGSTHVVDCPADCSGGVWGSGTYTRDSRICTAGVHAGLIRSGGGRVGVVLEAGRPAYRGSERHGIRTSDYGAYGASFRLVPVSE